MINYAIYRSFICNCKVKVDGTVIGSSSLDIFFSIIDDNHNLVPVVSKYAIETEGNAQFQLTSTEIRSKIDMGDYT